MRIAQFSRKLHRLGAAVAMAPLLVVVVTGILLQLKKESAWIQPPTVRGAGKTPVVSFEQILAAAKSAPEAGIAAWSDVDRLDVRPGQGVVKVQPKASRTEVQVDLRTGAVLQTAERRSDLLESLHDGSFFHERAKFWIFLPCGVVLFALWISGVHLFLLPHLMKRKRRKGGAPPSSTVPRP